jgi:hypothetical protein
MRSDAASVLSKSSYRYRRRAVIGKDLQELGTGLTHPLVLGDLAPLERGFCLVVP